MPDVSCPTVAQVLGRVDGGLARIRLPGGRIRAEQLAVVAAVARRYGANVIELTNRGNLQLRGVAPVHAARLLADLVDAGCSAGAAGDLRRNVLLGPLAGWDQAEALDLQPALGPLLERLAADSRLDGLSAKFGVVLDGGGRWHLGGRRDDVVVVPSSGAAAGDRVDVHAPGRPPVTVTLDVVPDAVHAAALASLGRPQRRTVPVPPPVGIDGGPRSVPDRGPLGVGGQADPSRRWVGAMPLLGRLDGDSAAGLAALAQRFAGGALRLTPWRGLVLGDVAAPEAPLVAAGYRGLGLVTDPNDPSVAVVACAGTRGCTSALTDARGDAQAVIEARRAGGGVAQGLHVSGCAKRCAQRTPAAVTLIGTAPEAYDVLVADPSAPAGERRVATGITRREALAVAAAGAR